MIKSEFIMQWYNPGNKPSGDTAGHIMGVPDRSLTLHVKYHEGKLFATFWEISTELVPSPYSVVYGSPRNPITEGRFRQTGYPEKVWDFIKEYQTKNPTFKYVEVVDYEIVKQEPATK